MTNVWVAEFPDCSLRDTPHERRRTLAEPKEQPRRTLAEPKEQPRRRGAEAAFKAPRLSWDVGPSRGLVGHYHHFMLVQME